MAAGKEVLGMAALVGVLFLGVGYMVGDSSIHGAITTAGDIAGTAGDVGDAALDAVEYVGKVTDPNLPTPRPTFTPTPVVVYQNPGLWKHLTCTPSGQGTQICDRNGACTLSLMLPSGSVVERGNQAAVEAKATELGCK